MGAGRRAGVPGLVRARPTRPHRLLYGPGMKPKRGLRARGGRPLLLTPIATPSPLPTGRRLVPAYEPVRSAAIPGPGDRVMAGTVSRITAYLVDMLLLGVLTIAGWEVAGRLLGMGIGMDAGTAPGTDPVRATAARLAISGSISILYHTVLWTGGRRTLGMRLMRLAVVRAADGALVRIPAAAARWTVMEAPGFLATIAALAGLGQVALLSLVGQGWPLILLLSVATSAHRLGLHDRAAGTAVVLDQVRGSARAAQRGTRRVASR